MAERRLRVLYLDSSEREIFSFVEEALKKAGCLVEKNESVERTIHRMGETGNIFDLIVCDPEISPSELGIGPTYGKLYAGDFLTWCREYLPKTEIVIFTKMPIGRPIEGVKVISKLHNGLKKLENHIRGVKERKLQEKVVRPSALGKLAMHEKILKLQNWIKPSQSKDTLKQRRIAKRRWRDRLLRPPRRRV